MSSEVEKTSGRFEQDRNSSTEEKATKGIQFRGSKIEHRKAKSISLLHKKALELEKKFLPDIYNRICAAL